MDNKVLIVEDEASIRSFLKINFKRQNFIVIEAGSAEEGIEKARIENPQIIILDVMLPKMDGFQACEILRREFPEIGIIMLTARNQDMDKIMGLEFGADDYMVKPFNSQELIARVNSILRRMGGSKKDDTNILLSPPFKIDTQSMKLFKNDLEIELTPKEYLIMKIFIENPDKAMSRDELLNVVWGYDYVGDTKIVDVNMRRLREKIEDNASKPNFIQTIWGIGYRWRKG